jgi:hypothetical protein
MVGGMAMAEQSSQQSMLMRRLCSSSEGCCLCGSTCVLFSLVHLLFELFGLLLIDKAQASQAFLEFKGMEESSILVVVPCVEDLLVPNNSSVGGRDIDHFDPVRISN